MIVNMCASTQLCSFDGSHIVSTRLDGSLFMQFNDGKRYGMAYFSDPYKKIWRIFQRMLLVLSL